MTEADIKVELRSDEVQEILSFMPHWIVRWGISAIFVTVATLFLASWIIRYPDIVLSRITITTQAPPISVVARSGGKLSKFFVKENQFVRAGDYLAAIENPANVQHVRQLRHQLQLQKGDPLNHAGNFDAGWDVGELQPEYARFLQTWEQYAFFAKTDYHHQKIRSVQEQIRFSHDLNQKLEKQVNTFGKEVELGQKNLGMKKTLFQQGLVSEVDLANAESEYLQKKADLEEAEAGLVRNSIQLGEYNKTVLDLSQDFEEKKRDYELAFRDAQKNLEGRIASWEQDFILQAPADGSVSFFKYWTDGHFVNANEKVMAIVPAQQRVIGQLFLPQAGSGKVKTGQTVNIKLDNYPFREFGIVRANIESISMVPQDNQYLVRVRLNEGLQTTYGKRLEFKQEMQGTAEIITEDLRLIERLFHHLRSLWSN